MRLILGPLVNVIRGGLAAMVLLSAISSNADDWARFRGPNGMGVGDLAPLPTELGPGPNVVWKTALPPGHSSPVVSGELIFLTAHEGDTLLTIALDAGTGAVRWRREAPRDRATAVDKRNGPASPSPVVDGRSVIVFFQDYGLVAYDLEGRERWRTPLGPFQNVYGLGASPIVVDESVVLVVDQGRGSFVAAFGKDDGRLRWKTPRPEALSGHSTPAVYRPASGPALILAPGSFRMDAYDARTGESVWWVNGLPSEMKSVPVLDGDTVYVSGYSSPENEPGAHKPVPSFEAVIKEHDKDGDGRLSATEAPEGPARTYLPFSDLDHDGRLDASEWATFAASMAAENGLLAFRLGGRGDVTPTALRWRYQRSVPQLPSPLLYRGVLYMINDGGILTTLDPANGEVLKKGRLHGAVDHYYASPVGGDGKVYFVTRSGTVVTVKAGGDQEILAVRDLDDECTATPAIAGGRIYLRTRGALYCFRRPEDVKQ
jgi:outer membrane protein assembly factor BamB